MKKTRDFEELNMDILYETVLMPKPPKIRGTSPPRQKQKKTKNLKNYLMKLSFFPSDRMRRDSTATAITTISSGSVESVNSREWSTNTFAEKSLCWNIPVSVKIFICVYIFHTVLPLKIYYHLLYIIKYNQPYVEFYVIFAQAQMSLVGTLPLGNHVFQLLVKPVRLLQLLVRHANVSLRQSFEISAYSPLYIDVTSTR